MNIETIENQIKDSKMIFTAITSGDFPTYELAQGAVIAFWVPDMSISRAGISAALKQLEKHYKDSEA